MNNKTRHCERSEAIQKNGQRNRLPRRLRLLAMTIAKAPIHLYRLVLSPWIGNACRFTPTCSAYALEAIDRHGPLKGPALAAWRILRCNPWNRCTGSDPVPETFDPAGLFRYKRKIKPESK